MHTSRRKTDAAYLALLCIGGLSLSAMAEEGVQSHASIRDAARQHVRGLTAPDASRTEISVGNLDSRLKLHRCDQPLETYDSPNGLSRGRGVVGVRCSGSKPWKIYVPLKIARLENVVVSRRPIVRGQTLQSGDLVLREVDTSSLHKAYFTRIQDVVGLRSKRSVSGGKTLHAGLLQRAQLIKRGNQVEIVAQGAGLHVRMKGKALADGSRGDRIRVKNLNSGRVITGTVTERGVIQVVN